MRAEQISNVGYPAGLRHGRDHLAAASNLRQVSGVTGTLTQWIE